MTRPAPLLVVVALLAGLALPRAARADAKQEADARMAKATELYSAGKFAEALNELTVAYTLDPRPELLYAIGQMHVQLGNCPQAILFYERFLSTKPEAVPAAAATRGDRDVPADAGRDPERLGFVRALAGARGAPSAAKTGRAGPLVHRQARRRAARRRRPARRGRARGVPDGAARISTYAVRGDRLPDARRCSSTARIGKRTIAAVLGVAAVGLTGASDRCATCWCGARATATTSASSASSARPASAVGLAPARGGGLLSVEPSSF